MGAPGRLTQQAASGAPEYRIAGATAHLDLKHQEAREFKLAVLREVAEKAVDAVTVDFALYPPHFGDRDPAIGRQLIRDVRAMLDEVGEQQNREIEPIVELPTAAPWSRAWTGARGCARACWTSSCPPA
ncbi:MAG: hypothetical protein ACP5KN_00320 [Armatimonadota bacterium]